MGSSGINANTPIYSVTSWHGRCWVTKWNATTRYATTRYATNDDAAGSRHVYASISQCYDAISRFSNTATISATKWYVWYAWYVSPITWNKYEYWLATISK